MLIWNNINKIDHEGLNMSERNALVAAWDESPARKPVAELVVRQENTIVSYLPARRLDQEEIAPSTKFSAPSFPAPDVQTASSSVTAMETETTDMTTEASATSSEDAHKEPPPAAMTFNNLNATAAYTFKPKYAFYESDYPADGVQRIKRNDGNRNTITLDVMRYMQTKLSDYASELARELGLSCNRIFLDKNLGENAIEFRISYSTINHVGMDKMARDFMIKAAEIGFAPADYGQSFILENCEYVIDGYDLMSNKIRVSTVDDACQLMSIATVKQALQHTKNLNIQNEKNTLLD